MNLDAKQSKRNIKTVKEQELNVNKPHKNRLSLLIQDVVLNKTINKHET